MPRVRGMTRDRLDVRVDALWQHGLALVVAPAGSGKTTLLAAWAAAASARGIPAAWCRAESTDGDASAFLGLLEAAVAEAMPQGAQPVARGWASPEAAVDALERWPGERLLLVIDDLHTIAGTAAEAVLGRLLDYAGPSLAVAAGTRSQPTFNLSRRRVSGRLLEITADDLRFRPWEVEALFRDYYGETLRGDELARLARRTEGWAAGLQLFHLATRGKPAAERLRILEGLAVGSRLVREYLARNVLDELPDELRAFLVETCVLRRLSGSVCDRFLDTTGSARLLDELERRQVFTMALDDQGTYRYHEVLRGHLEGVLVEERGEAAARAASARAASLLEHDGAVAEALAAWCRAEAWDEVARLLGSGGDRLAAGSGTWLDAVPPALVAHDPWLLLASARRLRAEGAWRAALDAFARAEASFGGADAAAACRRERLGLAAFLDPVPRPGSDWAARLRHALARDPLGQRAGAPADRQTASTAAAGAGGVDGLSGTDSRAGDALAQGIGALLGGRVAEARSGLLELAGDPAAPPSIAAAAAVAAAAAGLLGGDPRAGDELDVAVAMAERLGLGWLARIGRAAVALDPAAETGGDLAAGLRANSTAGDDRWGQLLGALLEGWANLSEPDRSRTAFDVASEQARALGAGTLEAWAQAFAALASARAGRPGAREAALRAEGLIRSTRVPGARAVVHLALAAAETSRSSEHLALAAAAASETGLVVPTPAWARAEAQPAEEAPGARAAESSRGASAGVTPSGARAPAPAAVSIRMFGGFAIEVGGRALDLSALKPRPRAVLRLLALQAGRPVHREVLAATFWPEADPETASRNLHVALSGLRRVLEGDVETGLLAREGDAYRLALPAGSVVDLEAFERAISAARTARTRGDATTAVARLRDALALAEEELLPEDGPASWVVERRELVRVSVAEAGRSLGELLLDDEPRAAAEVIAGALRVDPYSDSLWRLLVAAHERAGDPAAASNAWASYSRMLDRLGLPADRQGPLTSVVSPSVSQRAARPAGVVAGRRAAGAAGITAELETPLR